MSANASTSVTLPARIDFTSEPASTSPASSVSSTWYSCRARLVAREIFYFFGGGRFRHRDLRPANYSLPARLDCAAPAAYDFRMSPRRDAAGRRVGGLLFAVLLVASQANAWIHAVAIGHVACSEHGEPVHGRAVANGQERVARAVDGAGVRADLAAASGHDHCGNAALLRWREVALTARSDLTGVRAVRSVNVASRRATKPRARPASTVSLPRHLRPLPDRESKSAALRSIANAARLHRRPAPHQERAC
jgi:hypothetical protein